MRCRSALAMRSTESGSSAASRARTAAGSAAHSASSSSPQSRVLWGFGKEPVEQRPNVEVGAARHDRQPPAGANLPDCAVRVADEHPGRVTLARVGHVDQVVTDPRPGGRIGFAVPMSSPR